MQAASAVIAGGESIAVTGGLDHPPRVFDTRIPGADPIAAWQAVAALSEESGESHAQQLKTALAAFHPAVQSLPSDVTQQRIDLAAVAHVGVESGAVHVPAESDSPADAVVLLLVDWTFGTETLSAMAPALNKVEAVPVAHLHPDTIASLGLAEGKPVTVSMNGSRLTVPVQADPRMAKGVMVVPRHHLLEWQMFGETRVILERSQLTAERA